jgi:hypothetical protein
MTACEKNEAIGNRIDVCNQVGAVCRIVMTLKALRMEDRRSAEPDVAIAGSAVRKYATEFAASQRAASAGNAAEPATDSFIADATDPFAEPADE